MPKKNGWFDVDKVGLSKIAQVRGKAYVVNELFQNAWDQNVTEVHMTAKFDKRVTRVVIKDDDPDGFVDLALSHTLFAESPKKSDPTKRGRFNLGEKLVLSVAKKASLTSTKGTILFRPDGSRQKKRTRTKGGTIFTADIPMTRKEFCDLCDQARLLIPPIGITTTFNGKKLTHREQIDSFNASLPTIVSNDMGFLKTVTRKAKVSLHPMREWDGVYAHELEGRWLYEMGIPVMLIDFPWSINVHQRVPLGLSRESVPENFMQALRVAVVNNAHDRLDESTASDAWVKAATSDKRVTKKAFESVIEKRHGDKVLIESPFDKDSVLKAQEEGYQILGRGTLSPGERKNIKNFELVKTTSSMFGVEAMNFKQARFIPNEELTSEQLVFKLYVRKIIPKLLWKYEGRVKVRFINDMTIGEIASYGASEAGPTINFNIAQIEASYGYGADFWNNTGKNTLQDQLIIHEVAHEFGNGHRDKEYYDGLALLGARMKKLALENPEFFNETGKCLTHAEKVV